VKLKSEIDFLEIDQCRNQGEMIILFLYNIILSNIYIYIYWYVRNSNVEHGKKWNVMYGVTNYTTSFYYCMEYKNT